MYEDLRSDEERLEEIMDLISSADPNIVTSINEFTPSADYVSRIGYGVRSTCLEDYYRRLKMMCDALFEVLAEEKCERKNDRIIHERTIRDTGRDAENREESANSTAREYERRALLAEAQVRIFIEFQNDLLAIHGKYADSKKLAADSKTALKASKKVLDETIKDLTEM